MPTQFDQEQTKKLYQQLPERLREALASIEVAEKVDEICQKYGLGEPAQVDTVYRLCGDVLLGILPPEQLENAVTQETKINKAKLSPFMRELNRYVLYPYKPELNRLYGTGAQILQEQQEAGYLAEEPVESATASKVSADEAAPPQPEGFEQEPRKGRDKYREQIE